MPRPMTVSESVMAHAAPADVYALVSDPTQTSSWSPENTGATVRGPLGVDATFVGSNRRFGFRWVTRCRVLDAEPERRFRFVVEAIGVRTPRLRARIATWTYDLEPVDGGTRITETWEDGRTGWPDAAAAVFDRIATRSTFAQFNRRNIRTSLDRLKLRLEA